MGKKPDFTEISKMLNKGQDIELTDAKYETLTGTPLPKDKYYLKNNSKISSLAKEKNYSITVIEKKIVLKKNK